MKPPGIDLKVFCFKNCSDLSLFEWIVLVISKFLKVISLQPPSFSRSLEQFFFSNRGSKQFWKQNANSLIFLGLGSGVDGNADLGLGGDIVRYLFSIFPVFNFSYSLIGLGQTQAENNICINYVRTHHMFSRILYF